MSEDSATYRSLLRATGLVGGASIAVLVINLLRAKFFALLLGPAGIGLLGLLSTLVATAAAVGGMGLNTSAVRELARGDGDERVLRFAIWSLAWLLALTAGAIVWLLRTPISVAITGDAELAGAVGWSAIAVAGTVLAATQSGVFQGIRRIGDMARTNIGGTFLGTLIAGAAVYAWREAGIIVAIVVLPLCIAAVGLLFLRKSPPAGSRPSAAVAVREWRPLLHLGVGVVVTALLGTVAQLALRSIVLRELGLESVGLFQAALTISTVNIGLVLTAMAADFYPRLSQVSGDPAKLSRLLDQQLHLAALLSAPILIALSAGAPLWLNLLYSAEFVGAADLLRLQVVSETLRLPVWGMGFLLLARGDRRGYVINEAAFTLGAVGTTLLLVPHIGLIGAGAGYAMGYVAALAVTGFRVGLHHSIQAGADSMRQLLMLLAACSALFVIGLTAPLLALLLGGAVAVGAGLWALAELHRSGALPARVHDLLTPILPRRR